MRLNSKLLLSAVRGAQSSCQLAVWFTCLSGVNPPSWLRLIAGKNWICILSTPWFAYVMECAILQNYQAVSRYLLITGAIRLEPVKIMTADGCHTARRLIKIIWMAWVTATAALVITRNADQEPRKSLVTRIRYNRGYNTQSAHAMAMVAH